MELKNQFVFVVDDDQAARQSMAALIESRGPRTRTFASAEEVLDWCDHEYRDQETPNAERPPLPGCIICDLRMLGMNGVELQETVRRRGCRVPFIIVTAYGSVKMAVRSMEAGAITFLEKPCAEHVLWANVLQALEWSDRQQKPIAIRQRIAQLTESEQEVLGHIVDGKTNKAISAALDIGLRTVELRRSNIMKALGAQNLAELIRLVLDSQEERMPLQGPHTKQKPTANRGGLTSPSADAGQA